MEDRRPEHRFSGRADDYERYRPGYPEAAVDYLMDLTGLASGDSVADVGSGTGIFSGLLLARGLRVMAVEPNAAMRAAAERRLGRSAGFSSVDGTAEATGLPDASCDALVAAQAFHWFDRDAAGREFRRILRPPGWCALIWNERLVDADRVSRAYEQLLLDCGTDYRAVDHRQVDRAAIESFFGSQDVALRRFPNRQMLDLGGLKGRLRSSSYMPAPGDPGFQPMIDRAEELFHRHSRGGRVCIRYHTVVYAGRIGRRERERRV